MDQRVSLITLTVADLGRARAFYQELGWEPAEVGEGIVAFDLLGQTLALYPRADAARDMGVDEDRLATGGTVLAGNVARAEDVQPVVEQFRAGGGTVLRDAHEVFWGGTTAYVADPDGNLWEIAHNPHAPLAPDGRFRWWGHEADGTPRPAGGEGDPGAADAADAS